MTSLGHASPRLSLFGYQSATVLRPGLRHQQQAVPRRRRQPFRKPELFVQPRTRRPVVHSARSSGSSTEVRELEGRIREQLLNAEPTPLTLSAYDTAWVAMVPAAGTTPAVPRYPQCVDWILQNQRGDGSWRPGGSGDDRLDKDVLSSTLACVLALRTWGVGDEHVAKGLRFIGHNSSLVTDDDQRDTPAGFNIIFPGMLARGLAMGLEIPLNPADLDTILRLRDTELKSMGSASKAFMTYVAEGMGDLLDWDQAMEYQRKNGSFFNSPATTAAAAIHNCNRRALDYLESLISKFGSSVPTVHPRSIHSQLKMVDTLEKMGISPSFSDEINNILDMIYSSWLVNDEEIMLDMATCAMAFRLLRLHGYDIPSDGLARFGEESSFHDSVQGHLNDTEALLELYKASQVQILQEELILENIGSWTAKLLHQQLCSNEVTRSVDRAEVEHVLKYPFYATLDRLEHRRNIENFKPRGFQMLKSACRPHLADEEIVALAADSFHSSQAVYQQELEDLKSWVKEMRLDELEFARVLPMHTLFSSASTMFPSELSEARVAWSKNTMLTTAVDDLFDVVGTREEMENLITLIDKWDAHEEAGFSSERVEILFRAVYNTSNEIGAKAAAVQNGSVIGHIAELWAEMVRAMMSEAEWRMSGHVPSMEEYMAVALPSFALGPILPTSIYLVGPEIPDGVARGHEFGELLRRTNICGRLQNDHATYEREKAQGKLNSVLLLAPRHGGGSVEAARKEVKCAIAASRRELLRLVVAREEAGAVPRPCRALFWDVCKVVHRFYMGEDGYTSPTELMRAGNAVVLDPLRLPAGIMTTELPTMSVN